MGLPYYIVVFGDRRQYVSKAFFLSTFMAIYLSFMLSFLSLVIFINPFQVLLLIPWSMLFPCCVLIIKLSIYALFDYLCDIRYCLSIFTICKIG